MLVKGGRLLIMLVGLGMLIIGLKTNLGGQLIMHCNQSW